MMEKAKESGVKSIQHNKATSIDAVQIIKQIISFLQLFMCKTLAKRIVSMILLSVGVPNSRVTELTGLCDKSVRTLKKELESGDINSLFRVGGGGRHSKLKDVEKAIIDEINQNNYHSHRHIVDMVHEKFKIKVSTEAIRRLLKKNGIKRLKCGSLPAKADPLKQRVFYDDVLLPLMKQAKKKKITLLFVDASHFVMGCDYLGYIYGVKRRFIKTYSGRYRYNVLGALNFITKKVTTVTNDGYITAVEIIELLEKLAVEYAGKPIYIILDNARYQKCKIVTDAAERLGIHLTYIPPYSPNLNLVERFWKHVKSKLRIKYYDRFDEFKNTIDSIVNDSDKKDRIAINRLIGEKIQLFDEQIASVNHPNSFHLPEAKAA